MQTKQQELTVASVEQVLQVTLAGSRTQSLEVFGKPYCLQQVFGSLHQFHEEE